MSKEYIQFNYTEPQEDLSNQQCSGYIEPTSCIEGEEEGIII